MKVAHRTCGTNGVDDHGDIEGQRQALEFEVDSGACHTIPPKLTRGTTQLQTWSGQGLVLVGTAHVQVRFKTKYFVLPLLVMEGTGCNLLG